MSDTKTCPRCLGEGKIANSDDGEPWSMWANLPPGSDLAVQMGLVRPIPCPDCDGNRSVAVKPKPLPPREQLDAYAARPLPDHVNIVDFNDTAETFAPEAITALRAVLDLHAPEDHPHYKPGTNVVCARCIGSDESQLPYPCDTVTAITTALESP